MTYVPFSVIIPVQGVRVCNWKLEIGANGFNNKCGADNEADGEARNLLRKLVEKL